MSNELDLIYLDASVFLSYINGESEGLRYIDPMLAKSGKDFQLITSVLSITEVSFAKREQNEGVLNEETEEEIHSLWKSGSPIRIVEIYEFIALKASRLVRKAVEKKFSLKPADAIHLATADHLQVKEFHTFDKGFQKFAELTDNKFRIGPPSYLTPVLPFPDSTDKATSEV